MRILKSTGLVVVGISCAFFGGKLPVWLIMGIAYLFIAGALFYFGYFLLFNPKE